MTTYADFKAQLRRSLEEPVEGVWKDASLLYWTNEVVSQLARRSKPLRPEVYTDTANGVYAYALPEGTMEVINLFIDGVAIERVDYGDFRTLDQVTTGKPRLYAITEGAVELFPTPDAVYPMRLFAYASPIEVIADTDVMPLDSQYNTLIEYGVLNRCFEQINDWQTAEAYRSRFEMLVDEVLRQKIMEKSARRSVSPREVY